jgi:hypothetical protein
VIQIHRCETGKMHMMFSITKKYLSLFSICIFYSSTSFCLTQQESKQFNELDYVLKEGVNIEYKGDEQELYFVDKGKSYHYSRIQSEEDGDLFRWVELREFRNEKYVKYLAILKAALPEIVVREGDIAPYTAKTAPDTICDLVYDSKTDKPNNIYLVDLENQIFAPVLNQAVKELEEELKHPISTEQAVLFFYNRCSSGQYPIEQIKQNVTTASVKKKAPVTKALEETLVKMSSVEQAVPLTKEKLLLAEFIYAAQAEKDRKKGLTIKEPLVDEKIDDTIVKKQVKICRKIDNDIYKIEDEGSRAARLASFISQLEYVESWDTSEDSFSELTSLFNIAYPIFVHYEELTGVQKKKYARVIEQAYTMPAALFKRLDCEKRQAMNSVFNLVIGKTK